MKGSELPAVCSSAGGRTIAAAVTGLTAAEVFPFRAARLFGWGASGARGERATLPGRRPVFSTTNTTMTFLAATNEPRLWNASAIHLHVAGHSRTYRRRCLTLVAGGQSQLTEL